MSRGSGIGDYDKLIQTNVGIAAYGQFMGWSVGRPKVQERFRLFQ